MTPTRLISAFPMASRSIGLAVTIAGSLLVSATAAMAARVDVNRANDYYSALGTGELKVVEQYHLGPCEQRLRERDYQRAYNECNFILKIFPNHPQALLLTSQSCERWQSPLCRLDEVFQNAVAINPTAPGTYVVRGIYLHQTHQYGKAIQSYEYALKLDPTLMNAHYNLALSYIETKQFDLANEHAQRAYALGATLPGLRNMLQSSGHWVPNVQAAPAVQSQRSERTGSPAGVGVK